MGNLSCSGGTQATGQAAQQLQMWLAFLNCIGNSDQTYYQMIQLANPWQL